MDAAGDTAKPPGARSLARAAAGDPTAVTEFIRGYWPRVHRIAALITGVDADGEDVAQDAMLRAVNALPRLDLSSPIEPWIDRVAVNAARDRLRRRARRNETLVEDPFEEGVGVDWAQGLEGDLLSDRIREALVELSDQQRAVVVMRHLLDMPATEVASILELPEGTIRSLDHRALRSLREQLKREEILDAG